MDSKDVEEAVEKIIRKIDDEKFQYRFKVVKTIIGFIVASFIMCGIYLILGELFLKFILKV